MGNREEVKPSLPLEVVEVLSEKAREKGYTAKRKNRVLPAPSAYARELVKAALMSEPVIRSLSPYFRRGYVPLWDTSRAFLGHTEPKDLEALKPVSEADTKRLPLRFSDEDYEHFAALVYSLAADESETALVLITEALAQGLESKSKEELQHV